MYLFNSEDLTLFHACKKYIHSNTCETCAGRASGRSTAFHAKSVHSRHDMCEYTFHMMLIGQGDENTAFGGTAVPLRGRNETLYDYRLGNIVATAAITLLSVFFLRMLHAYAITPHAAAL